MKLSKVESEIFKHIEKYTTTNLRPTKDKDKKWTKTVKKCLTILGKSRRLNLMRQHKNQYKICICAAPCKKLNAHWGEWLYDLCWSKEGGNKKEGWKKFRGLALIAEIEWGKKDDILYDFQKLTVGIADHRLMVVWYNNKSRNRGEDWLLQVVKECAMCPNAFPSRHKFRYLMVGIPYPKGNFKKYVLDRSGIYELKDYRLHPV
ncbi:MAG: hypothetical protein HZA49_02805 [Planctomycetes bacterium]|nr:hypothetical protein [Planctomycetota bacterium]